ncbi:fumarate/nitrate reduction transcriptional regulator Fnr [Oxalobacteraceae bacterium A2-2]
MIRELPPLTLPATSIDALRARCATCSMHQLCLPMGLDTADMDRLDQIIGRRRKVARGGTLFRIGDGFANLYAVRLGHFKTYQVNQEGLEQITGFQMAGELLGMDAISADRHLCNAIALEDSEVCEIPFGSLQQLLADMPTLLRHFHRMMSQEITREQSVMLLLGNMQATQRFAAFLVNLSSRYEARGYSPHTFQLRMSREEIGNYLGLTIESISRLLSRFKKEGLVRVSNREIELLNLPTLKAITAGTETCA